MENFPFQFANGESPHYSCKGLWAKYCFIKHRNSVTLTTSRDQSSKSESGPSLEATYVWIVTISRGEEKETHNQEKVLDLRTKCQEMRTIISFWFWSLAAAATAVVATIPPNLTDWLLNNKAILIRLHWWTGYNIPLIFKKNFLLFLTTFPTKSRNKWYLIWKQW